MGWAIGLAVAVILLLLPLGARVRFDSGGTEIFLIAGWIRVKLFPREKKTEKPKKEQKNQEKAATVNKTQEKNSGGSLTDFLPLVQTALDFLSDFRRKLRVKILILHITLAGGDPDTLALNYGKANALLGNLDPFLERFFTIRKKDLRISCDFIGEETLIYFDAKITITLGRIFYLALRYGIRALGQFIHIINLRKGGGLT